MLYVVSYDIPCDMRRLQVADLLKDYGVRVQKSVFECALPQKRLCAMVSELRAVIDAVDSVRVYPCCASCASGAILLGATRPVLAGEGRHSYYII